MKIVQTPSPNFGPRVGVTAPDMIIIHHTAMLSATEAVARLCDPAPEVSAHYVIAQGGAVTQLVDDTQRAWHAGLSYWQGETDINSRSIGIELDNPASLRGFPPFPEPQMAAVTGLVAALCARWSIPVTRILGHSDVAPGRKFDPGAKFDWVRLDPWVRPAAGGMPVDTAVMAEALARIGYDPAADPDACLTAFRQRFSGQTGAGGPVTGDLDRALAVRHRIDAAGLAS